MLKEDVITLELSCEEAAMVWECVDWCRLAKKLTHADDIPGTPISLLNKIERQLGLSETILKGMHTKTQTQTQITPTGTQSQSQTTTTHDK